MDEDKIIQFMELQQKLNKSFDSDLKEIKEKLDLLIRNTSYSSIMKILKEFSTIKMHKPKEDVRNSKRIPEHHSKLNSFEGKGKLDLHEIMKDKEERKECQSCGKKEVMFDGEDEAGHLNYVCENCGEPQED